MSAGHAIRRAPAALGIDAGGTKVAVGIVTPDGRLQSLVRVNNRQAAGPDDLLTMVAVTARRLLGPVDTSQVIAVGVGLPELVDLAGEVRSSSVIPWTRPAIVSAMAGLGPVLIDADVRAAAFAEAELGAGSQYRTFCYLTFGTGISCTLMRDGRPAAGAHGAAQLLGSSRIAIRCPRCDAPAEVTLEDVASGPALVTRFSAKTGIRTRGAEDVLAAAERGETAARETVEDAARIAGSFIALAVNILDPEAVVIGGGLGTASGPWWTQLATSAREHIWASHVRSIPIIPAGLGPRAGVIGAGLRALREFSRMSSEKPTGIPTRG